MRRLILALSCLASLSAVHAVGAPAKDPSGVWDVKCYIQPQLRFDPRQQPWYHYRRLRGYVTGQLTKELKTGLTVDRATNRIQLLDLYFDYTPVRGPITWSVKGGLFFPSFAKEGVSLPNTVDEAQISTAFLLPLRQAGVQTTLTFNKTYSVAAGIFNGVQKFDSTNNRPLYFGSFTAVQPWFDARAWGEFGWGGTDAAPTKTNMYGMEITDIRLGRWRGASGYIGGRRFGKRMYGAYGEVGYLVDRDRAAYARIDWANTNGAVAGSTRQKYVLSLQQQVNKYIKARWDTSYYQGSNDMRGVMNLDVWF